MGDSRKQLREFPEAVRFEIGQALYQAELGERHPSACATQGLNAVEIVSDYRGMPTWAAHRRRVAFQSHDRERGVNQHAQKDTG